LWNVHRPKNLLHAVLQETHFRFRSINTSVSKYIWSGMFSTDKKSVRCFERIFSEINALDAFCKELKDGAFEGLCDCVCNRFIEWMNDKIRLCTLEHSSQEHIRQCFSTFWERSEQVQKQRRNYFECLCPVSSTYGVGTAIWDSDPDTANLVRYCNLFHSA